MDRTHLFSQRAQPVSMGENNYRMITHETAVKEREKLQTGNPWSLCSNTCLQLLFQPMFPPAVEIVQNLSNHKEFILIFNYELNRTQLEWTSS